MSRTFTIEKTVYTWDELSEDAKDNARQKHSQFLWECGSAHESMELIFDFILEEAGWEEAGDLTYSLYQRGGQPTFSGVLRGWEHEGRIYDLTVRNTSGGGSCHYFSVELEAIDGSDEDTYYGTPEWDAYVKRIEVAEEAAKDLCRDLSHKLLEAFYAEDEYMTSDEQMAETCEANGYEFTEDGDLA